MTKTELETHKNELEEVRELNNQVAAFWSKERRRNTAVEESQTSPIFRQASDDIDNVPSHSSKTDQLRRTFPEAKRSKIHSPLGLSNCAEDAADNTEELTGMSQRKSTRQPLGEVATLNSAWVRSPTRATSIQTRKREMGKEAVDSEMAEASFYNSDFFSSTDEQLVADIHSRPVQHGSDDTTVEF
ncbi:MAG: hypothetical protein LQ352_000713 [Teloschistes flavicans]|nr:MAG: hypothetical protein LQ352_000713 [Teloschistes flavicans]